MTQDLWDPDAPGGQREEWLETLSALCHLDAPRRLIQFGRDPRTARFSIEFADGRVTHLGTIDTLTSRTKLENVLLVTCGAGIEPLKPAEYRTMIANVIKHATDVEEADGEKLEDALQDLLERYVRKASGDAAGAAEKRAPFRDGDNVHVHVGELARWLRRENYEASSTAELRAALKDLGFKPAKIQYDKPANGSTRRRTTARYLRGRLPDHGDA